MNLIVEITKDILCNVAYFLKSNLRNFASIISFAFPYCMYILGCEAESVLSLFSEYFVVLPIVVFAIVFYINSAADKLGTGNKIPVPKERFTEVDENGEVSVRNDRVEEIILYLADLEDWMERKHIL